MVDAAPPGDSPGDMGVISGELFAAGGGKKVGLYQGTCVTVRPPDTSDCSFTLSLRKGQIKTAAGYGPDSTANRWCTRRSWVAHTPTARPAAR